MLWISDNGYPDLGGTNEDVPCFIDEVSHLGFRLSYIFIVVVACFVLFKYG